MDKLQEARKEDLVFSVLSRQICDMEPQAI
ncbi:hypothetical protein LINPERPRIM_LOCUS15552 [Linum perenne]